MPSPALLHALRALLIELDRPGAHITYDTLTKLASLYDGDSAPVSPRIGVPVSSEDLLTLFEKAWITRYDSRDGVYHYQITETGRRAIG